eukprot:UN06115
MLTPFGLNHHGVTFFDYIPLNQQSTTARYINIIGCDTLSCETQCQGPCMGKSRITGGIPVTWLEVLDMNPCGFDSQFGGSDCTELVSGHTKEKMEKVWKEQSDPLTFYNTPIKAVEYFQEQMNDYNFRMKVKEASKLFEVRNNTSTYEYLKHDRT